MKFNKGDIMTKFVSILLVACLLISGLLFVSTSSEKMAMSSKATLDTRSNTLIVGQDHQYTKIQDAIDAAAPGDTIHVYDGDYYENLTISKPLTIIGNSSTDSKIFGNSEGDVITINTNFCSISKLYITGSGSNSTDAAIKIRGSNNTIDNCSFDEVYQGIYVYTEIVNGTQIVHPSDNSITGCSFIKNDVGIIITNSFRCKIDNCYYLSTKGVGGLGIRLHQSNENRITMCSLNFGYAGVELDHSNDNLIEDCLFNMSEMGFQILYSNSNNIMNCSIESNNNGIEMDSSNYNSISYNDFFKNTHIGVDIESSNNNLFHHNNFIDNADGNIQVEDNNYNANKGNRWNLSSQGNYWSDWTTPDNDSDGIVDTPYVINTLGIRDHFPLVAPTHINTYFDPKPPAITTEDKFEAYVNVTYYNQYTAIDPDTPNSYLLWRLDTNAYWLSFTDEQELMGQPTVSDVGTFFVNVSVDDGKLIDFTNFTLGVLDTAAPDNSSINNAPIINIIAPDTKDLEINGTYRIQWNATDVDRDPLTITIEYGKDNTTWTGIEGATEITNNGEFNWDTKTVTDGFYYLRITAYDGELSSDILSKNFYVKNDNGTGIPDDDDITTDDDTIINTTDDDENPRTVQDVIKDNIWFIISLVIIILLASVFIVIIIVKKRRDGRTQQGSVEETKLRIKKPKYILEYEPTEEESIEGAEQSNEAIEEEFLEPDTPDQEYPALRSDVDDILFELKDEALKTDHEDEPTEGELLLKLKEKLDSGEVSQNTYDEILEGMEANKEQKDLK